jgi:vitamin B12 transporter
MKQSIGCARQPNSRNTLTSLYFALFGALAALVHPGPAGAETNDQDAVIVTATRTAQTADESLASVTVITRRDIEQSQAKTLPELLRGLPGVDLAVSGGYGQVTSMFLRGTNSDHVLVMIDGVKIGSATTGTSSWEFLPLSEIERVEIVRGPRSSLYGSDAVGGVVQIFTRRGKGPARTTAELGGGSHNTYEMAGGVSGSTDANDATWYNVHAGSFSTRGINTRQPVVEFGTPIDDPGRDGYYNRSVSAGLGHQINSNSDIELHALRAQGDTKFDNSDGFNNRDDFIQQVIGTKLRLKPVPSWATSFDLGQSVDDELFFRLDQATTPERFNTKRQTFSWQNDFSMAQDQMLTLGYDYYADRVFSTTDYNKSYLNNKGLFSQYQGKFGAHDLLFGLRRDDNEQFGHHDTGNVGWGYALTGQTRLIASYGTAFKAPTFNDLYFPPFFGFVTSNPNLKPERSKTSEIGFRTKQGRANWSVSAYNTDIDDLIVLDSSFVPQNISKAHIRGLEAEASTTTGDWRFSGGLSLTDPRDVDTDKVLPRRSRQTAKLDLDKQFGKAQLGIGVIQQGPRFDDQDNTIRLGGYSIINLLVHYELSKDWQLHGRIENLMDKQYQTVNTFNSPGRGYFLTLAYQPQGL